MRGRSQGPLALAFVALIAVAGVAAERVGGATPAEAPAPTVTSARWICPHGGGDGFSGQVMLMNPGADDVDVRITTLGRGRRAVTSDATVPASRQLIQEVPVADRGAATIVDAFGSWVGAAWLVSSDDPGGLGAEPCAPSAGRRWFAADPGTPQGDAAFLVVTNPFQAHAIVDVALYSADRPPIRAERWTDLEIAPRRSVALPVNRVAEGEEALLADVVAQVGRVAVASLVVGRDGGIRSAVASPAGSPAIRHLPIGGGEGPATLVVGVPGEDDARFAATLLSSEQAQEAGGLTDGEQAGPSARPYPIATAGPSEVRFEVEHGATIAAALRAGGRSVDDGVTAGTADAAAAWVVPSTFLGEPSFPSLVLVNPGTEDAEVTLRHLPAGEGAAGEERELVVPARSAVGAPEGFLAAAPRAAVLVRASGGEVVALGATASRGVQGYARYALALGVPLPPGV